MPDLFNLASDLEKLYAKQEKAVSDITKMAAAAVLRDLVYITPVDTSRALSNWQIGIGKPPTKQLQPYAMGSKGSTQKQSAAEAYRVGLALIKTHKPGQTIYISNNTPYIHSLDRGTSGQFPGGFRKRAKLIIDDVLRGGR